MLNDDLNRNDLNRDTLGRGDRTGMGGGLIGLIVAAAVIAILVTWAPWSGPRVADNTAAPGSTVGSSTRPIPPAAPAPTTPAAPTTR
jgi:hypothetical protein